jgi:predicted ribosomally synthesized peptide with nif11-like leader
MSKASAKIFIETAKINQALLNKLIKLHKVDEIVALGSENGFDFAAKEFKDALKDFIKSNRQMKSLSGGSGFSTWVGRIWKFLSNDDGDDDGKWDNDGDDGGDVRG